MKKFLSLILTILMILPVAVSVQADEMEKGYATTTFYQAGTYFGDADSINLAADYTSEIKRLTKGFGNMETLIEFSNPTARVSECGEIIRRVINEHPEFFYVSPDYYYYYDKYDDGDNPVVVAIEPVYTMNAKEAKERLGLMDKEVQHIIDTCIDDSMSDYDKMLEVHDYFCINYEYDTTLKKHSADYMLVDKIGVCEAYSLAYKYVLSKIGINCDYATSEAMEHIWNMVEYEGDWFHVDITWDDPVPNVRGRARHKYFMVDDETFFEEGHYGWVADHEAENKAFADSPLRKIDSAVYLKGGKYYHLDEIGNLCCSSGICKGDCEKKYENKSKYYIEDKPGYYFKKMSYLVEGNGCFYFTEADGVYKLDYTDENAVPVKVYTPRNNTYPVELILKGDKLVFKTAKVYENGTREIWEQLSYSVKHDGFYGDIDGDERITMADAINAAKSSLSDTDLSEKAKSLSDVDMDGRLTMADAILVAKSTVSDKEL